MIQKVIIPAYVYHETVQENILFQGDILKVQGQFYDRFKQFYPEVSLLETENQYVMVLTQSCDLVRNHKRKPNLKVGLTRLFQDKKKIDSLQQMERKELSKEITKILGDSGF